MHPCQPTASAPTNDPPIYPLQQLVMYSSSCLISAIPTVANWAYSSSRVLVVVPCGHSFVWLSSRVRVVTIDTQSYADFEGGGIDLVDVVAYTSAAR